ncbi:MAG: ATPase [Ruminococcaceae bacterium]|nr:ATPase [Oscillospiraceae bacterium]
MDIVEMLSELEDIIDKGFEIPIIKKSFIDKEAAMELLNDIALNLPDELRVARSVAAERQKIIDDAKKQADQIIKGAEAKIVGLIDEHEITRQANEKANEIITKAQQNSREIRLGTLQYADDVLKRIESDVQGINESMRKEFEGVNLTLERCRAQLRK